MKLRGIIRQLQTSRNLYVLNRDLAPPPALFLSLSLYGTEYLRTLSETHSGYGCFPLCSLFALCCVSLAMSRVPSRNS
jgi:hypothetical protein